MKVICDNCGAVYNIPEHKLVKEVNKATCRKCSHRMLIRRPGLESAAGAPAVGDQRSDDAEEQTVVASPSAFQGQDEPSQAGRSPLFDQEPQPELPPPPPPTPQASPPPPPSSPQFTPAAHAAPAPHKHLGGDLSVVMVGAVAAAVGAICLALASPENAWFSFCGILLALWGAMAAALVLVTGGFGKRKAAVGLSGFVSLLLAGLLGGALTFPFGSSVKDMASATGEASTKDVAQAADQDEATAAEDAGDGETEVADAEGDDGDDEEGLETFLPSQDPMARLLNEVDEEKESKSSSALQPTRQERTSTTSRAGTSAGSSPTRTSSAATTASTSTRSTGSSSTGSSSAGTSSTGARSTGTSSSSRETGSTSTGSRTATSTTSSAASTSSSDLPKTVPTAVIDIQIRNNKTIKACFMAYKQTTGELPPVNLRFTLESSGSVSSASLREADYKGTSLDACLSAAVRQITFPPFDGDAYTVTYPFRF